MYKFGVLLHKIFWFVVCFIFTVFILKLAVRFLATYLGVYKFILSEGSKLLSAIFVGTFWRKRSLDLYLVWTSRADSSPGSTQHFANTVCLLEPLGRTC